MDQKDFVMPTAYDRPYHCSINCYITAMIFFFFSPYVSSYTFLCMLHYILRWCACVCVFSVVFLHKITQHNRPVVARHTWPVRCSTGSSNSWLGTAGMPRRRGVKLGPFAHRYSPRVKIDRVVLIILHNKEFCGGVADKSPRSQLKSLNGTENTLADRRATKRNRSPQRTVRERERRRDREREKTCLPDFDDAPTSTV